MATIIFVLGRYTPDFDANVLCANNVIQELKHRGHKIICLCGTSGKESFSIVDDITVYRVHHSSYSEKLKDEKGFKKRLIQLMHFFHSFLVLPLFPNTEYLFYCRLRKKLKKILKIEKVTCCIGVFRPYSTIYSIIKQQGEILKIGYYLDILAGAQAPFCLSKKKYVNLCKKKEIKVFKKLDGIIMAENGKDYINSLSNPYLEKRIHYLNFPTLVFKNDDERQIKGKRVFVYAGYTNSTYRNPEFLIKIFMQVMNSINGVELHIYGKTDIKDMLVMYTSMFPNNIFYHGEVEKQEVDKAIMLCDCSINMGNSDPNLVPSKLFELIGMKKSILHISRVPNDSCFKYLSQYPNSCIINKNDDFEVSVERVLSFINENKVMVSDDYLANTFYSATPSATADCISNMMKMFERGDTNGKI